MREIALAEMVKAARARLALNALSRQGLSRWSAMAAAARCSRSTSPPVVGAPRVLVSELASVLSAFGAATSEVRRERVRSLLLPSADGPPMLIGRARPGCATRCCADLSPTACPEDRSLRRVRGRHALRRPALGADRAAAGRSRRMTTATQAGDDLPRRNICAALARRRKDSSGVVELVALRAIGIGRMRRRSCR